MNDIINFLFGFVQVVLAVVATVIAVNQRREQKYEMRCDDFKKTVASLNAERYSFYLAANAYYEELLEEKRKEDHQYQNVVFQDVLYKRDWVTEGDSFVPLNQVVLDLPERPLGEDVDEEDPDSIYAVWNRAKNPEPPFLPDRNDGYADNAKYHCGINLRNLPLYGMVGFERIPQGDGEKDKIILHLKKGYYFDFYDTCEVMSAEIAYYRRIKSLKAPKPGELPIRDTVEPFDLHNRFAGIGVITLTILENVDTDRGRKNYFLLHKRTQKVAEGTGSYHAVPAGSYQPAAVAFPRQMDENDRNLKSTVIREFGEELLDIDEFGNLYNSNILADLVLPDPVFVGVGLDPLNLKTELMACMVIDVQEDCKKEIPVFRGKSSYDEIQEILKESYEGAVTMKELKPSMIEQFVNNPMSIPAFRRLLRTASEHLHDLSVFKTEQKNSGC